MKREMFFTHRESSVFPTLVLYSEFYVTEIHLCEQYHCSLEIRRFDPACLGACV